MTNETEHPQKRNRNPGRSKTAQQRRRKYIENRTLHGMNKMDAALEAGFPRSMAKSAKEKIETPEVVAAIENMDKALVTGIPTAILVQKFAEGLEAKVYRTAQRAGVITDIREFPDYPTRLEYLEKIALISRRYEPKTTMEHTGEKGGPIELATLTYEELKQRKQFLERQLGINLPGGDSGGSLPAPEGRPKAG